VCDSVSPYRRIAGALWISDPADAGHSKLDCSRALASGLRFRGLEETVRDTLEWCQSRPSDHEWKAGIRSEREAELLKAWGDGTPEAS
jgi:2'-hydroxyisoflavone reductase